METISPTSGMYGTKLLSPSTAPVGLLSAGILVNLTLSLNVKTVPSAMVSAIVDVIVLVLLSTVTTDAPAETPVPDIVAPMYTSVVEFKTIVVELDTVPFTVCCCSSSITYMYLDKAVSSSGRRILLLTFNP